jgi:phosphate transport system substrate-binding protein
MSWNVIQSIPGAIGYLQYAYAHLTNMTMATLQNYDGQFIPPNSGSFRAALDSFKADFDPTHIPDPRGAESYPILSLSWLLTRKHYDDPAKGEALKQVLRYSLTDGQKVVEMLGYIPFSRPAADFVLRKVDTIQ